MSDSGQSPGPPLTGESGGTQPYRALAHGLALGGEEGTPERSRGRV